LDLDPLYGRTDAVQDRVEMPLGGHHRRGFGQAVTLAQGDAELEKVFLYLGIESGAAAHPAVEAAAELAADRGVDHPAHGERRMPDEPHVGTQRRAGT